MCYCVVKKAFPAGLQEELAARVAEQQAAVMAAGLLDKKEREDSSTVIGPSMPEPEPPHTEVQTVLCVPYHLINPITLVTSGQSEILLCLLH